jgi:hypothetical protein
VQKNGNRASLPLCLGRIQLEWKETKNMAHYGFQEANLCDKFNKSTNSSKRTIAHSEWAIGIWVLLKFFVLQAQSDDTN